MTVTLELLFPHLDDLIQTPADVQRLNEAILQLAVQGKLVAQDPHDEPAGELFERIMAEKKRLFKEGIIENFKLLPSITPEKEPFELPPGWKWVYLGDVSVKVQDGTHFSPKDQYQQQGENQYLYLTSKNIKTNGLDLTNVTYIDEAVHRQIYERCDPEKGDILLIKDGALTGVATVNDLDEEFSLLSSVALVKPPKGLLVPGYVKTFLNSPIGFELIVGQMSGSAIRRIVLHKIKSSLIPLPPLAEQKRIVAKVDELFAQTRALEAKLRRAQEAIVVVNRAVLHHLHHAADPATFQHAAQILGDHFDLLYTDPRPVTDLRQTILQLAVQGKLVPQDPHDEPAGELLKRIVAEREPTLKEEKSQRSAYLSSEIAVFDIPAKWSWMSIGDLYPEFQNGCSRRNSASTGKETIVLRLADIVGGEITLDDPRKIVLLPDEQAKYDLQVGDVLVTRVNGSIDLVGSFIPVKYNNTLSYCDHFIRMRIDDRLLFPEYLIYVGKSTLIRQQIKQRFITTAGQKTVNQTHIATLLLPLPPLAEQKRIVAKVDELLARCAALERKLGQAQAAGRQLTAAVLQGVVG